jgi:hypothetical protein
MTVYGVIVMTIGLLMALAAAKRETVLGGRFIAPIGLYAWHTIMVVAFWIFGEHTVVDATGYFDYGQSYDRPGFGTDFIMWLTGGLRTVLPGAGMLDIALIFGLFSFGGLLLFLRTAQVIAGPYYAAMSLWAYALALMPGMSFWTSAIGKDAPMFLAIQMSIFGVCRPRRNWPFALGGILIAFVIRPHIGAVMGLAAAVAFLLSKGVRGTVRVAGLAALALVGLVAAPVAATYLHVQSTDPEYLYTYIADTQRGLEFGGSAIELESYSFPVQVFSYLYRPTPIEINSAITLLAAAENTVLMAITAILAINVRRMFWMVRRMPALAYCATFFVVGVSASAMLTANLGMAARQKEQFVPCLFLFLFALMTAWKAARVAPAPRPAFSPPIRAFSGVSR